MGELVVIGLVVCLLPFIGFLILVSAAVFMDWLNR